MRSDATLIALLPASKIHSNYIPDEPNLPGVFVTPLRVPLKQIIASAHQPEQILTGTGTWQIDALSEESTEKAEEIGLRACEACLPSIPTAGLFALDFTQYSVSFDKSYGCYRAIYRLTARYMELITGT